jgi:hypothetical protein
MVVALMFAASLLVFVRLGQVFIPTCWTKT